GGRGAERPGLSRLPVERGSRARRFFRPEFERRRRRREKYGAGRGFKSKQKALYRILTRSRRQWPNQVLEVRVKKNILGALVFLLIASISGLAQQSNSAESIYNKWSQGLPEGATSKLRFALVSVTRRTSEEAAEIDLWAVGGASQAAFEIQPLYVEKLPNGEYKQEQAGALTKTSVTSSNGGREARAEFGLKVIAPVMPNTNAFEIKWFGDADGKRQVALTTQVLLLKDGPSDSLTTITAN